MFMNTRSKVTTTQKVLRFLSKKTGNNTLSASQMRARFGVKNTSSLVSRLRNQGYAIYLNPRKRSDGTKVGVYRLGTPSASMLERFYDRGIEPKKFV